MIDTGDGEDGIEYTETLADTIRGAVNQVIPVNYVQIGIVMDMPTLIDSIKAQAALHDLEEDASDELPS